MKALEDVGNSHVEIGNARKKQSKVADAALRVRRLEARIARLDEFIMDLDRRRNSEARIERMDRLGRKERWARGVLLRRHELDFTVQDYRGSLVVELRCWRRTEVERRKEADIAFSSFRSKNSNGTKCDSLILD